MVSNAATVWQGGHMDMSGLCVYEVKDGKMIYERFYV